MKQAILYVGHGSRVKKAQQEAAAFLEGCKAHISVPVQEISFRASGAPQLRQDLKHV